MKRAAWWVLPALVAGCTCSDTGVKNLTFTCGTTANCADGYQCVSGQCVLLKGTGDGGPVSDAGGQDGGRQDAGLGGDGGSGDAGNPNQLTVEIVGLPAGAPASVLVTGPGFSQVFTRTQILTGLQMGTYSAAASTAASSGLAVDTLYDGTVANSPVVLSASSSATLTVTYARRPGTGMMWLVGYELSQLYAIAPSQLASGPLSPTVVIDGGIPPTLLSDGGIADAGILYEPYPEGCAFDHQGNLWISSTNIAEYPARDLAASGTPVPAVTLDDLPLDGGGTFFSGAFESITFDTQGNLWVANCGSASRVLMYSLAQLTDGGPVMPATIINSVVVDAGMGAQFNSLECPYEVAFDTEGSLWVANYSGKTIAKFNSPLALSGNVTPGPDALLFSTPLTDGGLVSLLGPNGLAFDSIGDLWVATWSGMALERYANPASFSGTMPARPTARLTEDGGAPLPDGGFAPAVIGNLAFDNAGNAWVTHGASTPNNYVTQLTQVVGLIGAQALVPASTITGLPYMDSGKFCFDPAPTNVPIPR